MLLTGIVILTGVLTASYSPQVVDQYWLSWIPVCLFVAWFNPRLRMGALFLFGFLWATAAIHWQLDHRLNSDLNHKRLNVVGEVINIPKVMPFGTLFLFKLDSITGYHATSPEIVKLSWRNAPADLQPGQRWRLTLRLKRPHGFQNPGGFDYERWMFANGIHATGYVRDAESNFLPGKRLTVNSMRHAIHRYLQNVCPDCRHNGLIQALAIGYRGTIESQTRRLLKQTGTAHLIAVSGLHIGIVAAFFYAGGIVVWNRLLYQTSLKRGEFAMLLGWCAGLVYSLLSGFELPAQRAMLMLSIVALGALLRQPFNLLHGIMTTLVVVLVVSPLAVLTESFWLTFCALMIIALGSFLLPRETSRFRQLVIIQLLFSLLFIPLSIFIFGQIHSASLVANLIAVPLVSFVIVPLNFILLLLFWLPAHWLEFMYGLLDSLIDVLVRYLDVLQNNGLQAIDMASMAAWQLLMLSLLLVMFLLPRGLSLKKRALVLIALLLLLTHQAQDNDPLQVAVLDVGMGTSVVVKTLQHSLVYDFGPGNREGYSLGEWVVEPFLRHLGVNKPDRIVISHADQDHAGGFMAIQEEYKAVPVYTGTAREVAQKIPELGFLHDCHGTPGWLWDGVRFDFLSAPFAESASENNRSCVLRVSLAGHTILIAGDIEKQQEEALLEALPGALQADVLVAPHHGSLTSSSLPFIDAVAPSHVIFTAGYLNRWKFPKQQVLQRYLEFGSQIYMTQKEGAILINCAADGCRPSGYREQHQRIWY